MLNVGTTVQSNIIHDCYDTISEFTSFFLCLLEKKEWDKVSNNLEETKELFIHQ